MAAKRTAKRKPKTITTRKRKALKPAQFGLPSKRGYPVDTPARAANAKARATQQLKRGNLSKSAHARITAKANRVLKRKGRKKK